jgi:hypothetical protein
MEESAQMPDQVLDADEEKTLASDVLSNLSAQETSEAQKSADHVSEVMEKLVRLREIVVQYPSLVVPYVVAGENRDIHTLADSICRSNPYTIEAYMPTRAVVGKAYLLAKLNFYRVLTRVTRYHMPESEKREQLLAELEKRRRQIFTTVITEDVLVSIASDFRLHLNLRRKATYLLVDIWEHRHSRSVSDFFPLLDSAWDAKTRMTISYGTLSGTSEILSLMREGCDPKVIDYFTREYISEEERQALIELVFNATFEELEIMRRWMGRNQKDVLGPDDVAKIFNVPLSRLHQTIGSIQDMFFTFRERQVNAYHRLIHDLPGPKKTAEEYLMMYYLEQADIQPPQNGEDPRAD